MGLEIGLGREFRPLATLGVTGRGSGLQGGSFDGAQGERLLRQAQGEREGSGGQFMDPGRTN